jgi:hypothetical protein
MQGRRLAVSQMRKAVTKRRRRAQRRMMMTPMEGQRSGKRSVSADQERVRMIERRLVVAQNWPQRVVESIHSHLRHVWSKGTQTDRQSPTTEEQGFLAVGGQRVSSSERHQRADRKDVLSGNWLYFDFEQADVDLRIARLYLGK